MQRPQCDILIRFLILNFRTLAEERDTYYSKLRMIEDEMKDFKRLNEIRMKPHDKHELGLISFLEFRISFFLLSFQYCNILFSSSS